MTLLSKGAKAPQFTLKDKDGKDFEFRSLLGKKNIVLYFYPRNETMICTKEACSFRDNYEDFTEAGAEVVGISGDSVRSHEEFATKRRLPFILLSDPLYKVHELFGAKPSFMGLLKPRVTFVIDKEGVIRHVLDARMKAQAHIDTSLEALRALE